MKSVEKYVQKLEKTKANLVKLSNWKANPNSAVVTVHCFVFNQEKYIARCIDSMLNQLVSFNVEIIVHDDCSTDNSRKIIEKYCKKYPDVIKSIFEENNIYSRTGNFLEIAEIVNKASNGKYIAICEGDDYWTDPMKLFLQVNVLEEHENCHFCVHRVAVSSGNDSYLTSEKTIPSFKLSTRFLKDIDFMALVNDKYNFQTSSYFFRKKDYDMLFKIKPEYMKLMPTDDEVLLRHFGIMGNTCFIDKVMSTYLQFTDGSWSKEHKDNKDIAKQDRFTQALREFDKWTNYKYHKSCNSFLLKIEVFSKIEARQYEDIFKNKFLRKTLRKIDFKTYMSLRIRRILGKI